MSAEQPMDTAENASFDPANGGPNGHGKIDYKGFSTIQTGRSIVLARRQNGNGENGNKTQSLFNTGNGVVTTPIASGHVINDGQYSDHLLLGCSDRYFETKLNELRQKSPRENSGSIKAEIGLVSPAYEVLGESMSLSDVAEAARTFGVSSEFFNQVGKLLFERISNDPRWSSLSTEDQSVLSLAYTAIEGLSQNMNKSRIAFLLDLPKEQVDIRIGHAVMRAEAILASELQEDEALQKI